MDEALLLARIQFGLNIAFHILFPAITIGLGWLLVVFRLRYERTRDPAWLGTYKLWVKVFALSFAISSQCWPMERPVRGSAIPGAAGARSQGRTLPIEESLSPQVLPRAMPSTARCRRGL